MTIHNGHRSMLSSLSLMCRLWVLLNSTNHLELKSYFFHNFNMVLLFKLTWNQTLYKYDSKTKFSLVANPILPCYFDYLVHIQMNHYQFHFVLPHYLVRRHSWLHIKTNEASIGTKEWQKSWHGIKFENLIWYH
jgi:hypothetical protein